jgi:hypothetical protein
VSRSGTSISSAGESRKVTSCEVNTDHVSLVVVVIDAELSERRRGLPEMLRQ